MLLADAVRARRRTDDWIKAADRERAARASAARIREAFQATITVQTTPTLANVKHGFFLTYINSFNEWHEGHQFEPMKDAAALSSDERAIGYHNPADGGYRLETARRSLRRHRSLTNDGPLH